jgi:hypothetical protein
LLGVIEQTCASNLRYADVFLPGRTARPFLSIQAANRGRRPVTLNKYGMTFSDRTEGVFPAYPMTPLPKRLQEGESYTGFVPLRSIQEAVRAKPARLTAVYFDTDDDRRFRHRIWPWSSWHRNLRAGELAPAPTNEELLDPLAPMRKFLEGQGKLK